MDLSAIATALAARYAAGNVTPPTGRSNITLATATPPNKLAASPAVVVWPQSGDLTIESGQMKGIHDFTVSFYYARREGDVPRESAALLAWVGVLLGQTFGQTKLGLAPGVDKAIPVRWEIGTLDYAGDSFDGISITVRVWTTDIVSLVP